MTMKGDLLKSTLPMDGRVNGVLAQGAPCVVVSYAARETHGGDYDDDTQNGVCTREVRSVTPQLDRCWRSWFLPSGGRPQNEIVNGAHSNHRGDGDELARERVANAAVPERRGCPYVIPLEPTAVIQVDQARDDQNCDRDPASCAELQPHLAK